MRELVVPSGNAVPRIQAKPKCVPNVIKGAIAPSGQPQSCVVIYQLPMFLIEKNIMKVNWFTSYSVDIFFRHFLGAAEMHIREL